MQEDVAQGSALRRLRAQTLVVDPLHEREEIGAGPVEPAQVTRKRGRSERPEILRPDRLTGKQAFGVALGETRLDLLVRIDRLAVAAEVAQVRTDGIRRGRERLVGGVPLHDATE